MNSVNKKTNKYLLPICFALTAVVGMGLGYIMNVENRTTKSGRTIFSILSTGSKMDEVLELIKDKYVEDIGLDSIEEVAVNEAVLQLDPHSNYIPAKELQAVNEPLEGNFEGIGVEFYLLKDTIYIVSALPGGPSEAVGVHSGDKIVTINGKNVAGIKLQNSDVVSKLRGPEGTKVKVGILRKNASKPLEITITRGKIPVYSVDVATMIDKETGYIKINSFGANTPQEVDDGLRKLLNAGMTKLVLDLRGNPGGYLEAAVAVADEFLGKDKLVVFTEGRNQKRIDKRASDYGLFEKGKLTVLIDEGSASASEIVSGALQDWDRATIVGRRSFGKGLVQEQIPLSDGSAIRLTVARYYTPSGRCIQKSYKNGREAYEKDINERYTNGEFEKEDSSKLDKTLKYKTVGGRTVYGGGGVLPDTFVGLDTTYFSNYYTSLFASGSFNEFVYQYLDKNKKVILQQYTLPKFVQSFNVDALTAQFIDYAERKGVKKDLKGYKISEVLIKNHLKALIARVIWQNEGFFTVNSMLDNTLKTAIR